ncbi:hypothetical protein FACS1894152_1290 [Bacilli bacterium]|nr:hypothetical protein FACS1894152_1290 [Bacilli bacterium]
MRDDCTESIFGLVIKIGFNIFLMSYFVYHILNGKYGVLAYRNMGTLLLEKENILGKTERVVKKKQNKIGRLKKSSLDGDLFEEEVRRNMGIIDNNEIVIFY